MTIPLDLRDARPERYSTDEAGESGVPNFRAASGENGENFRTFPDSDPSVTEPRPGLFGTGRAGVRKPRLKEKREVPKLTTKHRTKLEDFYKFIGVSIRHFDEFTGDVIIEQAEACAASVYELAQENDAIRRAIISFTTVSTTGAVIMAHLPILLAVARHSKNDSVKLAAASSFVAMKYGSQQQADNLFTSHDQDGNNEQ